MFYKKIFCPGRVYYLLWPSRRHSVPGKLYYHRRGRAVLEECDARRRAGVLPLHAEFGSKADEDPGPERGLGVFPKSASHYSRGSIGSMSIGGDYFANIRLVH